MEENSGNCYLKIMLLLSNHVVHVFVFCHYHNFIVIKKKLVLRLEITVLMYLEVGIFILFTD